MTLRATLVLSTASIFMILQTAIVQTAMAQTAGGSMTVTVSGARNAKGQIRAALYNSASGFPEDSSKALQRQVATIDPQTLTARITFADLPKGEYAISLFHDENMNGKLDKNFLGIPKEGYGASNNRKKMGPPTFEEAKVQWSGEGGGIEIWLQY